MHARIEEPPVAFPMKYLQYILLLKGIVYNTSDSHVSLVDRVLLVAPATRAGLDQINDCLESPELNAIDPKDLANFCKIARNASKEAKRVEVEDDARLAAVHNARRMLIDEVVSS